MRFLTLNRSLATEPFIAESNADVHGRFFAWGCPYRPAKLYLDPAEPPSFEEVPANAVRRPEPGKCYVRLDAADALIEDRNFVRLRRETPFSPKECMLAVQLAVPHGLKGQRLIEVTGSRGVDPQRIHNDFAMSWKLADGRSLLYLWALVLLRSGDTAQLLHVQARKTDLLQVSLRYNNDRLSIRHSVRTPNAAPIPSSPAGAEAQGNSIA